MTHSTRKNLALTTICSLAVLSLAGARTVAAQTITEVDLANDKVEIVNHGVSTVDITTWWACNRVNGSPFYRQVSAGTVDLGLSTSNGYELDPGEILVVSYSNLFNDTNGELGLYNSNSFGSASAIEDYVLWGANGIRDLVAQNAGIWVDNDAVDISGIQAGETIQLSLGQPGDEASHYQLATGTLGTDQSVPVPVELQHFTID